MIRWIEVYWTWAKTGTNVYHQFASRVVQRKGPSIQRVSTLSKWSLALLCLGIAEGALLAGYIVTAFAPELPGTLCILWGFVLLLSLVGHILFTWPTVVYLVRQAKKDALAPGGVVPREVLHLGVRSLTRMEWFFFLSPMYTWACGLAPVLSDGAGTLQGVAWLPGSAVGALLLPWALAFALHPGLPREERTVMQLLDTAKETP